MGVGKVEENRSSVLFRELRLPGSKIPENKISGLKICITSQEEAQHTSRHDKRLLEAFETIARCTIPFIAGKQAG
jgi:hypothetical protein